MTSKATKICLSLLIIVGLSVVGFLLGMAIRSEIFRDKSAKASVRSLVVLAESSQQTNAPEQDGEFLRKTYEGFFKHELDIEAKFSERSEINEEFVERILTALQPKQVGGEQADRVFISGLEDDQTVDDWLYSVLSGEGTDDGDTIVKQFNVMSISNEVMHSLMSRLSEGREHEDARMFIIEVLQNSVRANYVSDKSQLIAFREFIHLEDLRKMLCPFGDMDEMKCNHS